MRARQPDESGYVVNSGVRIHYEVHGTGQLTILLLPTWAIVDSRHWKMQVPFLARHYRVITFDPRGNGRPDRHRACGARGALQRLPLGATVRGGAPGAGDRHRRDRADAADPATGPVG